MIMLYIVLIRMSLLLLVILFVIVIFSNNDQCRHVALTFKYSHKGQMCNRASNVTK